MAAPFLRVLSIKYFVLGSLIALFLFIPPLSLAADEATKLGPNNYGPGPHTDLTGIWLEKAVICHLTGIDPTVHDTDLTPQPDKQSGCVGLSPEGGEVTAYLYNRLPSGGALGSVTTLIGAVYNPPTSSMEYMADLGRNFGIVQPAFAQVSGSGEGIIAPILQLWKVVRNVSFMGFILVFLTIGFMIMFRQKLNPQTVISAQNALPGVVIGLILVYFSYFISALLVDTAFVGIPLVGQVFAQSGARNIFGEDAAGIQRVANESNIFNLFTGSVRFGENFWEIRDAVSDTYKFAPGGEGESEAPGRVMAGITGAIAGGLASGPAFLFGGIAGAVGGLFGPEIVGFIVPVILIIALLIQYFKLLFKLIQAYISILVMTTLGPIIILASSIPGKGGALSLWWKTILANALIFPAVFGAFLFAGMILGTDPKMWTASPPLFGGMATKLLRLIIAYGIILGIPAIPDMVKNAMGVKDIQGIPQAAMAGITAGAGVVQSGVGRATKGIMAERAAYKEAVYNARYRGAPAPMPSEDLLSRLARGQWKRTPDAPPPRPTTP